jgi:uncharacterized Fe-S cluster protein YjdI
MEGKDITKEYTNGEITVIWKPSVCIHLAICWRGDHGLKSVFDPSRKPWIDMSGASSDEIMDKVNHCPSGALSYYKNEESLEKHKVSVESIVEPLPAGPLLVYGNISVKRADGTTESKHKVTAFCRCGASENKPYCDGTHTKVHFEG